MLVNRVLLGLDDIEKYKDNPKFMTEIIRRSKEKSYYEVCSDNVKHNKDLVCMIIDLFKDDTDFIKKVVNEFLSFKEQEIINEFDDDIEPLKDVLTVLIKVDGLDNKLPGFVYYRAKLCLYYNEITIHIKRKQNSLDYDFIGGFYLVLNYFSDNKIISDYFAEALIDNYFESNLFTILSESKKRFSSFKELENNLDSFVFDILNMFDNNLAIYTLKSSRLLAYAKENLLEIDFIFDNNKMSNILLFVEALVGDFVSQNMSMPSFGMEEALYMVFSDLNMLDTLEEWTKDYSYLVFDEKLIEHAIEFRDNMGNNDLIIYLEIEECIKKIIGKDLINKNKPNKKIIHLRDYK